MTESRRNPAIDLLRGGSILYIVGYWHLLGYIDGVHGYKNVFTVRLTVVVLGLFTLMAGVLAGRRPIRSAPEAWMYCRARALRILPPYALALVLFGLTHLLDWRHVGLGLLLLPAVNGEPLHTLWYVNMLVFCYGLAPWLLLLCPRRRLLASGLALALLLLLLLLNGFAGERVDPRLALYFPAFATGLLLSAQLLPGETDRRPGPLIQLLPLVALAIAAVTLSLSVPDGKIDTSPWAIPLATIVPALVMVSANRWLRGRTIPGWLRATSSASYFLYLLHRPLFEGLQALAHWLQATTAGGQLLLLLVFGVPLIARISWWAQRLYDRFLRALAL
jgi:peptidoglycan/LPS O-acetylase OafA/YrhL